MSASSARSGVSRENRSGVDLDQTAMARLSSATMSFSSWAGEARFTLKKLHSRRHAMMQWGRKMFENVRESRFVGAVIKFKFCVLAHFFPSDKMSLNLTIRGLHSHRERKEQNYSKSKFPLSANQTTTILVRAAPHIRLRREKRGT